MNPFEEMTDPQLEEGLVQANGQLRVFLSRHMGGRISPTEKISRSVNVAAVLETTLRLQNVVKMIEAEIRSRAGEPAGLTARFEMKMSPAQKQWVLENGGAAKVRELIDQVRQ